MLGYPDFENYWDDEDLLMVGPCEMCEDFKLVAFTTNPFAVEINDDHSFGWECAECHYESSQDI